MPKKLFASPQQLSEVIDSIDFPFDETWLCSLEQYAILRLHGKDTFTFLQNNLSSNLKEVTESYAQLSSYCNAKGRVSTLLFIFKQNEDYFIRINQGIKDKFVEQLQKFILRDDVHIDPCDYIAIGIAGKNAQALLELNYLEPSATENLSKTEATLHCTVVQLVETSIPAFEVYGPTEEIKIICNNVASQVRHMEENAWKFINIIKGIPDIYEQTSEKFIPQMINLDILEAVSFSKGCFPGQEIIARTHYRGQLKQRMFAFITENTQGLSPGDAVYATEWSSDQPVGKIVECCALKTKLIGLVALRLEGADKDLTLHQTNGAPMQLWSLPYSIPHESINYEEERNNKQW